MLNAPCPHGPTFILSNAEPGALEALYARYLADPESVDRTWRLFFAGFDLSRATYGEDSASPATLKEFKVLDLIHGYRTRGHLFTQTNPVRERRTYTPTLALENFDLSEADLDTVFQAGNEVGIVLLSFETSLPIWSRRTATRLGLNTCTFPSPSDSSGFANTSSWPTARDWMRQDGNMS